MSVWLEQDLQVWRNDGWNSALKEWKNNPTREIWWDKGLGHPAEFGDLDLECDQSSWFVIFFCSFHILGSFHLDIY